MDKKRNLLLELFFTFLKIGAFTFGGGYAMIALFQNDLVSKKKWISEDEFLEIIAIAESTPGPIAINSATYIGYKMAGFWGSFFSTLAICIPSFTVVFAISLFFDKFLKFTLVAYAFKGIQICVVYLIFSAGIKMFKNIKNGWFNRLLFCFVLVIFVSFSLFAVKFSTIYYIIICGGIGIFAYALKLFAKGGNKK
ncbi:MAG: chromate transporter [Clostridia bacterium]|nr:chromate transporter [Clostridia bacterium]